MLKITNPATGTLFRELETDSPANVAEKFKRAARAQREWARAPLIRRLEVLKRFRGLAAQRKEKLAAVTTSEVGKPISQSRNELDGLLGRIDFFLAETEKTLEPESVLADAAQRMDEKIAHEPLGVIANISAWN